MKRLAALALFAAALTPALAQTVSGVAFNDRNGNGIMDAGEEPVSGVAVRLIGKPDAGGTFDTSLTTGANGSFSFAPGNGCYLLDLDEPAGWRRSLGRFELHTQGSPGYTQPAGQRRYGGGLQLLSNLKAGTVRYTSMGDSIAYNWNSCFDTSSFWYSLQVRDRLRCVAPAATVNLDQSAVKGSKTEDLLANNPSSLNTVFGVLAAKPQLVTISIIGNDLLGTEPPDNPTPDQVNKFVAELIDSRSNMQELISSLVAGLPGADVELNTLYDNRAYLCATNQNHREWLPIVNFVLRDLAWGQARRVTNAEIFADFASQDLLSSCYGFQNMICQGFSDGIHPKQNGYSVIREKVWEALDGTNLGPKDGNAATSLTADHGLVQRVLHLLPSTATALSGASVTNPGAAFSDTDGGAGASVTLGIGSEEVRFAGFPGWYDEVVPVEVVAGIRYRTTGTVTDDFYRVEASVNGVFRPAPGHAYTATDWNYYTPIVGSGGPNMPPENPDYPSNPVLVTPNVTDYRTVSATLTKNPTRTADGRGYVDTPLTYDELGTSVIRVASFPVAKTAGDAYQVVVDAAFLDVYGWTKPRPAEITNLAVTRSGSSLVLAFDALASSERYNVYAGSLATLLQQKLYDYGSNPHCNVSTSAAGPNRLTTTLAPADVPAFDSYLLVTGRVNGVESPAGYASNGSERDRSQNTCP